MGRPHQATTRLAEHTTEQLEEIRTWKQDVRQTDSRLETPS